jgi:hypothetical protein
MFGEYLKVQSEAAMLKLALGAVAAATGSGVGETLDCCC